MDYGRAGFDVETYSPVDLKKSGAWNYSRSPEAELLCFAPSIDGHCLDLWIPGQPLPEDWLRAVYGPQHWAVAFNWWFEFCVFNNIMVRQLKLPAKLPPEKFDCVAARGRSYGMPQNLEGTTEALNIPMGKISGYLAVTKPRKATAKNPDTRWSPKTSPDKFKKLYDQCLMDEWGEVMVDRELPPWQPLEQQIFRMDQKINARGVPIDRELCVAAIQIIGQLEQKYWLRLKELTGGLVNTHSEIAKIVAFIKSRGVLCDSISKDAVDTLLNDDVLPDDVREILEIRKTMGLESIKKFKIFLSQSDSETSRVYDQFTYYGAQATGRWAARGCQLHAIARGSIQVPAGENYDEYIGNVIQNVKKGSLEFLELLYERPVEILSGLLRPTISAPPGKELCVSDYSNIEGRIIFWLAGIEDGLEIFRQGRDLYIVVAASIYAMTYEQLYSDYEGGSNNAKIKRQMGKQAVLGLNYQMGSKTFVATVNKYNIVWDGVARDWASVGEGEVKAHRSAQEDLYVPINNEETGDHLTSADIRDAAEIEAGAKIVDTYRTKFPGLKKFWTALEKAAINVVISGCAQRVGAHLFFEMTECGRWLRCKFPSGQFLYWFSPKIQLKRAPWCVDDDDPEYRNQLTFLKWVKGRYLRESTYGGDLAESVTQKVGRDFLANGMVCAENSGYNVIMHVHDEVVALQDKGTSNVSHFNETICQLPEWATGFPLKADGWVGERYRKG